MSKATATKAATTSSATEAENEEAIVEQRISELEAELASLDGPPPPLSLTDLAQGLVQRVDKDETRRRTIARYLSALKIKRLEMRRAKLERKLEPFREVQRTEGAKLEDLEAQRNALTEEINDARGLLGDANTRAMSLESHIRQIDREIDALRVMKEDA